MPADNNGTEREIRSLTAARSDGGTHRADWSAAAFARLKSVIVTGMKNQVRFIQYGIEVVRAKRRGEASTTALDGGPGHQLTSGGHQPASAWTLSPSPQTRSPTLAPPTRRGYDDRTRKARFNTGERRQGIGVKRRSGRTGGASKSGFRPASDTGSDGTCWIVILTRHSAQLMLHGSAVLRPAA